MSTAAHPIRDLGEFTNPNVVKTVLDAEGFALYFSRATIPWARDAFAASRASPGGPGRDPGDPGDPPPTGKLWFKGGFTLMSDETELGDFILVPKPKV